MPLLRAARQWSFGFNSAEPDQRRRALSIVLRALPSRPGLRQGYPSRVTCCRVESPFLELVQNFQPLSTRLGKAVCKSPQATGLTWTCPRRSVAPVDASDLGYRGSTCAADARRLDRNGVLGAVGETLFGVVERGARAHLLAHDVVLRAPSRKSGCDPEKHSCKN